MKREEQIEVATAAYINGRLRNNVPPEEIEEIRLAYQAGAIYADEHPINYDGKAMLHVLNKGHEQGWKDAVDKAVEWIKQFAYNSVVTDHIGEREKQAIIIAFKQAMEESK